jgi:NAD(P)-dependent dehydrogenase (short-subunit alcohol dehydrogenase family)
MSKNFGPYTTAEEVASVFASQIKGKHVLITGCTWGGLGSETARVSAKFGAALVVLAGRSQGSIDATISKIKQETPTANLRSLIIDLASLESVRQAAAEVNAYEEPIDILINNAAVMASDYFPTQDGFEGQFGCNHLGHFVFTNLILSKMFESTTGGPRVVNVASSGHHFAPIMFDDPGFSNGKTYKKWIAYGQSKTANILFAKELSNRYKSKGLLSYSLHPGSIDTNLQRHIDRDVEMKAGMVDFQGNSVLTPQFKSFLYRKTVQQGASTTIVAAFDPSIKEQSGLFLNNAQVDVSAVKPWALDDDAAQQLWSLSEDMVGQKFPLA